MRISFPSLPRLLVFNLANYTIICMISTFVTEPMDSNFFVFAYTVFGIPTMLFLGSGTSIFYILTKQWWLCLANTLAYVGTILLAYLQR
ncbi:hypothetical protein D6R50_12900 [Aeromonas veronii]|uniref:Uncharacterized protein n=1 Tax=Aeromonas veronii TaxID=654 RepID=A0A3A9IUC6_AERVE|nr:hypothetical protein D6R50_12900 [Aeromonas veronii]